MLYWIGNGNSAKRNSVFRLTRPALELPPWPGIIEACSWNQTWLICLSCPLQTALQVSQFCVVCAWTSWLVKNVCERQEGKEELPSSTVLHAIKGIIFTSVYVPQWRNLAQTHLVILQVISRRGKKEAQRQQGQTGRAVERREAVKRQRQLCLTSQVNCISNSFRMIHQAKKNVFFCLSVSLQDPAPPCRWLNTQQLKCCCCSVQFVSPVEDTCCLEVGIQP